MAQPEIKKKSFIKRHPNIITLIISLLILGAVYVVFINAAVQDAKVLADKDITAMELELKQKQARLISIKNVAKSIDDLPKDITQKLFEALPPEPQQIDLLVQLANLVKDSNLELNSIDFGEIKDEADRLAVDKEEKINQFAVKEFSVGLQVEGISYTVLKRLLKNIESSLRLIRVNSISFQPDTPQTDISLTAFYLE